MLCCTLTSINFILEFKSGIVNVLMLKLDNVIQFMLFKLISVLHRRRLIISFWSKTIVGLRTWLS